MTPPAPAPVESLYRRSHLLTPELLRAEIQRLTADQLDQLVHEMDAARNVPPIFRNVLVRDAIEERIALADITRERWQDLRRLIADGLQPVPTAPIPASYPLPLSPAPLPPQPSSLPTERITGETGLKEWAGDHKGMIVATAGLAILGFFAIRYWAQKRAERAAEAQEEAAAIAEGREPPKPKSWLWKLLIPSIAVGGGALAIEAYKNRKKIVEKAKEGAENVQKRVNESAEAQEGIENARYGLVSAGLLLLDRDLMPESTRFSDAQRSHILTGFLEDRRIQNVPISQVLNIENERDVAEVFGDIIANRPADERRVLYFLAQSCKKHQEYVTDKARRFGLSDEEIMQMPLIEYVDQLAEISSTFGQLTEDIATKIANKDIDIGNIDWKNIFNAPQFIHNLKTDRVFMQRIIEHYPELQTKENDFMLFCAANGNKTMHNLSEQLRENIPDEKKQEWQMFQGILKSMHQYIQDQTEYLTQYTHGEERFAGPLKAYLQNYLTVFDTVQLYYYMQQMVGRDGNFLALKESPHFTSFLLQAKIISMVKKADVDAGQRMFFNLTGRVVAAATGATADIELPDKAKELFASAAGTLTSAAHKMLTEGVHKFKQFYQSGVMGANKKVGIVAMGGLYAYGQIKLNAAFDGYDARLFARTPPDVLMKQYGISPKTITDIKAEIAARSSGKSWFQNKLSPGYDTTTMHGQRNWLKPWKREEGGIWDMIQKGQKKMDQTLIGGIKSNVQTMNNNFKLNGTTLENQLKNAKTRADANNILKKFNGKNQWILQSTLDQMATKVSTKGITTFAELAEKEPHVAATLTRNLRNQHLTSVFGQRVKLGETIRKGARSRVKLLFPLLILRALTSEEKIPLANLAYSTAIQLIPIAGTLYDIDTLVSGKDRITGEKIDRWHSAGFVAIGAATDTVTVLGAIFGFGVGGVVGVGARAAAFSARAGVKTVKITKNAAKASKAMTNATRIALKAEKIANVARWTRLGGVAYTIGGIGYGLYFHDGQAQAEESEDVITGA